MPLAIAKIHIHPEDWPSKLTLSLKHKGRYLETSSNAFDSLKV